MKTLKHILIVTLAILLNTACNKGIDPITPVDPGVDETAPMITFKYPIEGTKIKVFEEITSITIKIEVTDDIEILSISALMDGVEIANFSSFKDYRRALEEFAYDHLTDGNHKLSVVAKDMEGKITTSEVNFAKEPAYVPLFEGESFFMPFDGDYMNLIGFNYATKVGTPGFAGYSFAGIDAYKGATDSYITFPSLGLMSGEFSAAFWYKVNPDPDRAGILVVGNNVPENRNQGFRMFREGSASTQRIKLNVGTGSGESWNDGGVIDVAAGEWVHIAFTISQTKSTIYFNGIEQSSSDLSAPISWTGCEKITIGAGGETFSYWNHKSDLSDIDELRLFNKALTQSDIQIMINSFHPYTPEYDGESFFMPFDLGYVNLIGSKAAEVIGSPEITDDTQKGAGAYLGSTDSYLNYPAAGLLSNQFSASFWYKVNSDPDRAGIIVVGNDVAENRNQGFRLFREGSPTEQRIKANIGFGTGESWNDGGVIDVTAGDWVHIALTISDTKNTIYINGTEVRSSTMAAPISWTGCENITIGSGGETFSYWGHISDGSIIDELRFFNKELSAEEVATIAEGVFAPKNYGSTFYMPFDGTNKEANNNTDATMVGTTGFAGVSKVGSNAFAGATDSYLTFPTTGLFGDEFSGAFWYKVNASPDRAGILVVGPPMNGADNVLTSGFRLFREGSGTEQRIKLHVGTPQGDVWNDGDVLNATTGEWVHIAFTVSATSTLIYFNGVPVTNTGNMTGKAVSWTDCDILSIGSGAPRFSAWNHLSDLSFVDDLFLFDKALSQEEIQTIMNNGSK